jgi:cardiolipin synthase
VLHAKYGVIDDDWSTIGSFNVNVFSAQFSNEVNLVGRDRGVVDAVARLFLRDLARCERTDLAALAERSIGRQAADEFARFVLAMLEQA